MSGTGASKLVWEVINLQLLSGTQAKGDRRQLAPSGQAALDLTQPEKPRAILMDIQRPVVDGLTAIRRLQTRSHLAHIPIIALTAFAMEREQGHCQFHSN